MKKILGVLLGILFAGQCYAQTIPQQPPQYGNQAPSIYGLVTAGSGVTITGSGTAASPFSVIASGTSGVSTFTGDGTILSNSASSGAVTATLENAAANSVLGNNTGSSAAPSYQTLIDLAGAIISVPSTLTISTSTFTPVAVASNTYRVVLIHASCPCTIANPSGTLKDGANFLLEIWQSSTGSDTIGTWGSTYDFGTAGAPTLTTTASKGDILGFHYSAQNSKLEYLGVSQGF
jgi:hypothetical protein